MNGVAVDVANYIGKIFVTRYFFTFKVWDKQTAPSAIHLIKGFGGFKQTLLAFDPKPNRWPSIHFFDFKLFHIL